MNTPDRKPYSKKKAATIEDLKVTPSRPVRDIVPMDEIPLETKQLSFECFDEDYLKNICASIYDDDNYFEKYERRIHLTVMDCIRQILEKKSLIHFPANFTEMANEARGIFVQRTLTHFLPAVEEEVILAVSKSVLLTISGLFHCISLSSCFKYKSILDQAEKILFFPSKKHMQFYLDLPFNLTEIEAITPDKCDTYISPYAKSQEEEDFVSISMEKTKTLLKGDPQLSHLLNMLALFTPVNVDITMDHSSLFKYFQEKITMMMYTHLMKRTDNINSLSIMSNLASMMGDFNTVGKIMAESIIKNDEATAELENIDIAFETSHTSI